MGKEQAERKRKADEDLAKRQFIKQAKFEEKRLQEQIDAEKKRKREEEEEKFRAQNEEKYNAIIAMENAKAFLAQAQAEIEANRKAKAEEARLQAEIEAEKQRQL